MKRKQKKWGLVNKVISLAMAYMAVRRFLSRGRYLAGHQGAYRKA